MSSGVVCFSRNCPKN